MIVEFTGDIKFEEFTQKTGDAEVTQYHKCKAYACMQSVLFLMNIIFPSLANADLTPKLQLMKRIRLSSNFAVFVLFFGVASIEAFRTRDWLMAGFWFAIGLVFLLADNMKKKKSENIE